MPTISGLQVPSPLFGGDGTEPYITVTMSGSSDDGSVIYGLLESNNKVITFPGDPLAGNHQVTLIQVPAGQNKAIFYLEVSPVDEPVNVAISAINNESMTVYHDTITVQPPEISSLYISGNPEVIKTPLGTRDCPCVVASAGLSIPCSVTLGSQTPPNGTTVSLATDNPSFLVPDPAKVQVPSPGAGGSEIGYFNLSVLGAVPTNRVVTITATTPYGDPLGVQGYLGLKTKDAPKGRTTFVFDAICSGKVVARFDVMSTSESAAQIEAEKQLKQWKLENSFRESMSCHVRLVSF